MTSPQTPWDAAHAAGIAGRPSVFECDSASNDVLVTSRIGSSAPHAVGITIATKSGDRARAVVLTPANARRAAAALLNAADEADGTVPLVFLPRQPDEPKRRL